MAKATVKRPRVPRISRPTKHWNSLDSKTHGCLEHGQTWWQFLQVCKFHCKKRGQAFKRISTSIRCSDAIESIKKREIFRETWCSVLKFPCARFKSVENLFENTRCLYTGHCILRFHDLYRSKHFCLSLLRFASNCARNERFKQRYKNKKEVREI